MGSSTASSPPFTQPDPLRWSRSLPRTRGVLELILQSLTMRPGNRLDRLSPRARPAELRRAGSRRPAPGPAAAIALRQTPRGRQDCQSLPDGQTRRRRPFSSSPRWNLTRQPVDGRRREMQPCSGDNDHGTTFFHALPMLLCVLAGSSGSRRDPGRRGVESHHARSAPHAPRPTIPGRVVPGLARDGDFARNEKRCGP